MSIETALGRIRQLQDRIGAIENRVKELPGGKFAAALDKAEKPVVKVPSPTVSPPTPLDVGTPIAGMLGEIARRNQLDPALLKAVMTTESNGNPNATSPVGAMGLMQLMPGTAKDLGVTNPYDPKQNLQGGAQYLSELTKKYGLENGVAAYNAGPGAVESHGGIPPYKETQHYVQKVLSLYNEFKK